MTEADNFAQGSDQIGALAAVFSLTNPTEKTDVEFFFDQWATCSSRDDQMRVIRSFRNQLINVAAGRMYDITSGRSPAGIDVRGHLNVTREQYGADAALEDAAEEIARLRNQVEILTEALRPFAQTGWMTSDTEHTDRTVIAHMHPESAYEIVLSSGDFRRAASAIPSTMRAETASCTCHFIGGTCPVCSVSSTVRGETNNV